MLTRTNQATLGTLPRLTALGLRSFVDIEVDSRPDRTALVDRYLPYVAEVFSRNVFRQMYGYDLSTGCSSTLYSVCTALQDPLNDWHWTKHHLGPFSATGTVSPQLTRDEPHNKHSQHVENLLKYFTKHSIV